jgi:competence protein ComEC
LLPGLVDGDTSGLDDGVRQRFLVAGMSHLTAVSGANLAVVLAFVVFVGRWVRWGARVGAVVGLVATAGFVVLVRPDPSVLRAAAMGGLGLVGVVLRRPGAAVPGLAAGVFVLLVVDPGLAGSAGFALSALATVGLLLFGVAWRDRLRRCRVPAGLAEALSVPLAAQVACAPVIAGISGSVGVAAVPANVLAEPAVAPATVLGVGAAAVSPVSPWLAHALAWLAAWPCRWLVLVAGWSDRPASLVPWPSGTSGALLLAAALLAVLLLGTAHRVTGWALLALAAGALPAWLLTASWPHPT